MRGSSETHSLPTRYTDSENKQPTKITIISMRKSYHHGESWIAKILKEIRFYLLLRELPFPLRCYRVLHSVGDLVRKEPDEIELGGLVDLAQKLPHHLIELDVEQLHQPSELYDLDQFAEEGEGVGEYGANE